MTHDTKLQDLPSRPDKHVVFTIILPLVQVRLQFSPSAQKLNPYLAHNPTLSRNQAVLLESSPHSFRVCIHHRPHPFPLGSLVFRRHLPPSQLPALSL